MNIRTQQITLYGLNGQMGLFVAKPYREKIKDKKVDWEFFNDKYVRVRYDPKDYK